MNHTEMIADQRQKAREARESADAILATAEKFGRKMSRAEETRFQTAVSEARAHSDRADELQDQLNADNAASSVARKYAPPRAGDGVTRNEGIYTPQHDGPSFFRDIWTARNGNWEAAERLRRNNEQVAETRAISTTNSAGGEFVPPLWLESQFIKYARPGRITANLCADQELPAGTDSINVPKVNTGTAVASQSSQNTAIQVTDLTTASVASPVVTIAGGQTVSLQLLEQSPINIDNVILSDLAEAYATQLNTQVLSGPGTGGQLQGLTVLSGTNSVTFTSTTPTLGGTGANALYPKLANAVQLIHTKRYMPPDAIIMHPTRWAWCLSQSDSSNRPLVTPRAGAFNPVAVMDDQAAQGLVGEMLGLPVYVDATIPTNLGAGTNQDQIIVARMSDLMLFEGRVKAEAFQQTYAQNLSVFCRLYCYSAFLSRYPQSISVIGGTGLTTPTF